VVNENEKLLPQVSAFFNKDAPENNLSLNVCEIYGCGNN